MLNLGSLALGLLAWMLPVISLVRKKKAKDKTPVFLCAVSTGACAVSLCLQIFEMHRRVTLRDWSALMDTSGAVAWVAAVLLVVTIALNAAALAGYGQKHSKG